MMHIFNKFKQQNTKPGQHVFNGSYLHQIQTNAYRHMAYGGGWNWGNSENYHLNNHILRSNMNVMWIFTSFSTKDFLWNTLKNIAHPTSGIHWKKLPPMEILSIKMYIYKLLTIHTKSGRSAALQLYALCSRKSC